MEDFNYITTLAEYEQSACELEESPQLALDTETYVLPKYRHLKVATATDPHTGRISLLTLKGRETIPFIFDIIQLERQDYDRNLIYKLLVSRERLIGQSIQFDLKFLKRHYGVIFENAYDIRLLAKLITNATGSKIGKACGHSLKDLCRDWLNIHITGKGKEQTSDWYPRPESDQDWKTWQSKLTYAADDTNYLFPLHDLMIKTLSDPLPYSDIIMDGAHQPPYGLGMESCIPLQMFMTAIAAEMEYNGLPASKELLAQLQAAIWDTQEDTGRLLEVSSELCKILDLETSSSLWSDLETPTDRSFKTLNNPTTLKNLLGKKVGLDLTSSQAEVISRLIDLYEMQSQSQIEFVDSEEEDIYREILNITSSAAVEASHLCKLVNEYKQLRKQFSMDLGGYINPITGCIHSRIDMLGASTSRSSCAAPNLQQVSGRTHMPIDRPKDELYPYSANYEALEPDWEPQNV